MDGFVLFPMNQTIDLAPGDVYRGYVQVANSADATSDFYYRTSVMPYGVTGEDYTIDLATMSSWTQIVDWVKIDEPTGKIAPNEVKKLWFTIEVPESVPAGGQYFAIGVSADKERASSNGVSINDVYEMASVVYADVAGETIRRGEVMSNAIPGFVASGKPVVSAMVNNSGNIHEKVEVTIEVKNALGGGIVFPLEGEENTFSELVMPETTKYLVRELDAVPALGVFEVTQNITYLGETFYNTKTLIMCPIWFLVLLALLAMTFGATLAAIVKKHRKKKS